MKNKLFKYQLNAIEQLRTGSILYGGVGSGKTLTSIAYYFLKECNGDLKTMKMESPKDLYVITTSAKRDTLDWLKEAKDFLISTDSSISFNQVKIIIDSWNNIKKYKKIKNSFFIFDEQRVVGYGSWVKSFLKITKNNNWILLTATPGDSWMDYIPVFIANGFYKNKSEFIARHVVYTSYKRFPKVDHYVDITHLNRLRKKILVVMDFKRIVDKSTKIIKVDYDLIDYKKVFLHRWNIYKNLPIRDISEYCYTMRRVVNESSSRISTIRELQNIHKRIIIFYNFNYELEILRNLKDDTGNIGYGEYNGNNHDEIPKTESWYYIVQYRAGSEGLNCTETDTIVFYSLNYSYRTMMQAAGRIDRLNTPFKKLYYYYLISDSFIDRAIQNALKNKQDFNETKFINFA